MVCSLVLAAVLLGCLPWGRSFCPRGAASISSHRNTQLRSTVEEPALCRTTNGTIYVLFLEDSRFYVGKTVRDADTRLREHFYGDASHWTRQYRPKHRLQPLTSIEADLESWERAETLDRMYLYGMERVRGWIYTRSTLSAQDKHNIAQQICERKDLCRRCGVGGHGISTCASAAKADWMSNPNHVNFDMREQVRERRLPVPPPPPGFVELPGKAAPASTHYSTHYSSTPAPTSISTSTSIPAPAPASTSTSTSTSKYGLDSLFNTSPRSRLFPPSMRSLRSLAPAALNLLIPALLAMLYTYPWGAPHQTTAIAAASIASATSAAPVTTAVAAASATVSTPHPLLSGLLEVQLLSLVPPLRAQLRAAAKAAQKAGQGGQGGRGAKGGKGGKGRGGFKKHKEPKSQGEKGALGTPPVLSVNPVLRGVGAVAVLLLCLPLSPLLAPLRLLALAVARYSFMVLIVGAEKPKKAVGAPNSNSSTGGSKGAGISGDGEQGAEREGQRRENEGQAQGQGQAQRQGQGRRPTYELLSLVGHVGCLLGHRVALMALR